MKYANQMNFVIAVVAVVVVGFALSRTYWSGEPAYPETAMPALDSTPATGASAPERARPAGVPRPAPGAGRSLPVASSVPNQPGADEEPSESGREEETGDAPAAGQAEGVEPIVIQRRGADRESAADRNESGQAPRGDTGSREQQLEDDEQPQAPPALPGSGGSQRRQSPPPPPTRSSMPGDLP